MRTIILAVPLLYLCAVVQAGSTVYACKSDTGTVYQDKPCATVDATISAKVEYAPKPCGSSCGKRNGNNWEAQVDHSAGYQQQSQHQVSQGTLEDEDGGAAGYQCEGNGKRWVQSKPCPASTTAFKPVMGISGTDQYGNHVTGSGTLVEQVPVDQRGLSHNEYCTRLQDHEATSDKHGKDSPSAVYDRNKARQGEGC